jgi:hypothetical protein
LDGGTARRIVHREALTDTVSRLLTDFTDGFQSPGFNVRDPLVEEVIGHIFATGGG